MRGIAPLVLVLAVGPAGPRAVPTEGSAESTNGSPVALAIDLPVAAAGSTDAVADAGRAPLPSLAPGETLVARAKPEVTALAAYDRPYGALLDIEWMITNPSYFGGPLVLKVVEGREDQPYVRALLPVRPNGTTGWIRTADFDFTVVATRVEISLGDRAIRAFERGELIAEAPVVVGTPSTPTPLGTFFINERIEKTNPSGPYGPWILGVAAFSETLASFDGGIPVIGIHGTNRPELVGQARSNGCVRVPNEVIDALARRLPLGTPVSIID